MMQKRQTPVIEVCTFFSFALIAYYVANILDCSGIIAIMTTGFWLDIYVRGKPISEHDFQMELNMQSNDFPHYQHLVSSNTTYTTSSSSTTNTTPSLPPFQLRLPTYGDLRVMFSGVGHISHHAKVHVGFVSEVLSNIMETAIFAYLGLFIFNNNKWDDIPLISTGILSCTLSRIIMVVLVSLVVNSVIALKYYTFSWFRRGSRTHETNSFHDKENMYIDRNMQQILIFSGIRGAVSLALVENIPLFDAVTKGGTKLKPELKAMTSSSIIFTVFVFGAYSYRILKIRQERFTRPRDSGHLQHDYLTESLLNSENNIE
jgi:NhaP-type Na+/H+ or K+/H+ antiporter